MAKSMGYNAAAGLSGMLKDGHKTFEGVQGAVVRNIEAAKAISGKISVLYNIILSDDINRDGKDFFGT
jgi:hypothetical protein